MDSMTGNNAASQESVSSAQAEFSPQQNRQIQLMEADKQFRRGISWYYWIAGLSLINSVLILTGAEWGFIIGLGATQLVDAIVLGASEEIAAGNALKFAAFGIDLLIAGVYVLLGFLGLKRFKAAIITGMVFYVFDGLLFLLATDFLSIAFHAYVLFCIFGGLKGLNVLRQLEAEQAAAA